MDLLTLSCPFQLDLISRRYNKHLTNYDFLGQAVSYVTLFFPHASHLGHKLKQKNLVCNLQHGPWTQLERGIYSRFTSFKSSRERESERKKQKKNAYLFYSYSWSPIFFFIQKRQTNCSWWIHIWVKNWRFKFT